MSRSRRSHTSEADASIVVRDATADDARAILEVRRRSWQVAYAHAFPDGALEGMEVEPWIQWWRDRIESPAPRSHTVVADRGQDVIGFCHLGPARGEPDTVGELYAIYVHPEAWSGGAGRALMSETLGRLRGEAFAEAILWVLEDNPRTRTFYELAGWHADGGVKDEEFLDTTIREVRYRITL